MLRFIRLTALVSVSLVLTVNAATLGLYFDQDNWQTDIEANGNTEMWLVLRGAESGQAIAGWECSVETTAGTVPPMVWELQGQGPYNFASPPQFAVGFQNPAPATDAVVLARATVFLTSHDRVDLRVQPYLNPSINDDDGYAIQRPVIARSHSGEILEIVQPAAGGSWVPEARINGAGPTALPGIAVTGDLDFGAVPTGGESIHSLTLHQDTEASLYPRLQVQGDGYSLRLDDGPWTSDGRWLAWPAGGDVSVEVRLAPMSTGPAYGSLVLDDGGPLRVLPLTGGGGEAPPAVLQPRDLGFGTVPPGGSSQRSVTLRNTSDDLLTVEPGQPAAPFQWLQTPEATELAPGAELVMTLVMNGDQSGLHLLEIPLGSNVPPIQGQGQAALEAGCTVWVDDPDAGFFGEVPVGYPVVRTVHYRNDGFWEMTGEIAVVGDDAAFVLESGGGLVTLPPGATHTVVLRCAPPNPGPWSAVLVGPSECQEMPLECTAVEPVPVCVITPEILDFGEVMITLSHELHATLINTGNIPLAGGPVIDGDPAFELLTTAPFDLVPGDSIQFTARFTPTAPGEVTAFLDLGLDVCGPLPMVGFGFEAAAGCEVDDVLDFGQMEVGTARVQAIGVLNDGQLPLVMDPVVSDGFLLVGGANLHVPPGETVHLQVECRPEAVGPISGVLDLGSPACSPVNLTGTVVFDPIGGSCLLQPSYLLFPSTTVLEESRLTYVIINGLDTETSFMPTVNNSPHFVPADTEPVVVPPFEARWLEAVFRPLAPGVQGGSLTMEGAGCGAITVQGLGLSNGCDVDPVQVVFPTVMFGSQVSATVEVANTGDTALVLAPEVVDPIFDVDTTPIALEPQAEVEIEITAIAPVPGLYDAILSLGSELCIDVSLHLEALSEAAACEISPTEWQIDNAYAGIPESMVISVENHGSGPLSLDPVIEPADVGFTVTSFDDEVAPGSVGEVRLQFLTDTTGHHTAILDLGDNGCAGVPLAANVSETPSGDCEITPSSISLPEMPAGVGMITSCSITNAGVTPLVLNLQNQEGYVHWEGLGGSTIVEPGQTIQQRLRLFAPGPGQYSYVVEVSPGNCGIQVSGYGTSPEYPCQLDPFVADFGEVLVGQSRYVSMTMRNIGDSTLLLDVEDVVGPFHMIGAGPRVLAPLYLYQPGVRFQPTMPGEWFMPIGTGVNGCGPILARGDAVTTATGLVAVHAELDFGVTDPGAIATLPLTVMNLGETTAAFEARVEGGAFHLDQEYGPCELAPGAETTLLVNCRPDLAGNHYGRLHLGLPDHPAVSLRGCLIEETEPSPSVAVVWDTDLQPDAEYVLHLPPGQTTIAGSLVVEGASPGSKIDAWRGALTCHGGDLIGWQLSGEAHTMTTGGGVPLQILPGDPLVVDSQGRAVLATFTLSLSGKSLANLVIDGGAVGDWPQIQSREHGTSTVLAPPRRDHVLAMVAQADEIETPSVTALGQLYPNPFNPTVNIPLELAGDGHVKLVVYDMSGRQVAVVLDQVRSAGEYLERWNGRDTAGRQVASGAYYLRMEAGGQVQIRKMTMLK